jgi:hypothetical protein
MLCITRKGETYNHVESLKLIIILISKHMYIIIGFILLRTQIRLQLIVYQNQILYIPHDLLTSLFFGKLTSFL